jgi:YHS domain-containing protein
MFRKESRPDKGNPKPEPACDPVCGMLVHPSVAVRQNVGSWDYCFCSDECRMRFVMNPNKYLAAG